MLQLDDDLSDLVRRKLKKINCNKERNIFSYIQPDHSKAFR